MDSTTLAIVLSAQDKFSSVFGMLHDKLMGTSAIGADAAANIDKIGDSAEGTGSKMRGILAGASVAVAVGVADIGYHAVKAAANFQQLTTTLVTTAGESEKNIGMVRSGILQLSTQTGTSATDMGKAMYIIESAGYHAADGLKILQAAAEGAKAENADLGKVADAVTSSMRDYHLPTTQAADVTSKLVAAVGAGKANFEEFTGALHSVLPIASAAHVSLDDVLGSLASMTVHGMSADQASQNLAHSISKMQSPTQMMTSELSQLGIKSSDLSDMLGKKGISGTLETISQAIQTKMGPNMKIMIDAFNGNKLQAEDALKMYAAMPPALQKLADAYSNGSMTLKEYRTATKDLPPDQANLIQQYSALTSRAKGFSDILKSGKNPMQSYSQALQAATGDATTMNVALMTTGENAAYTRDAVDKVGKAHAEAGGHVAGWAYIQGNMNQQLSQAKQGAHNMSIALGSALLPAVTKIMVAVTKIVTPIAEWVEKHQKLASIILGSIGVFASLLAVILTATKVFNLVKTAIMAVRTAMIFLNATFLTNPITLIIMAIALAAYLIITHWKEVSKFFKKMWDEVKHIFDEVWGWIKQHMVLLLTIILGPFGLLLGETIKHWKAIKNAIVKAFEEVWHFLERIGKDIFKVVETYFLLVLGLTIMIWRGIWNAIKGPVEAIWNFIRDIFMRVFDFYKSIFEAVWNTTQTVLTAIWNVFVSIWTTIWTFFANLMHTILNFVLEVWNMIYSYISSQVRAIWNVISSIWNAIWNTITSIMHTIWNTIVSIWQSIYGAVSSILGQIYSTISGIVKSIIGVFSGAGSWLIDAGENIIKGLIHGIEHMAGEAAHAAAKVAKDAINAAKSFLGIHSPSTVFMEIGDNVGKGLKLGIDNTQNTVADSAKGLAKGTVDAAKQAVQTNNVHNTVINGAIGNSSANNKSNGDTIEIHLHVGALMGNQADAQQFATIIYQQFQRIARRHGNADALPQIGILPQ